MITKGELVFLFAVLYIMAPCHSWREPENENSDVPVENEKMKTKSLDGVSNNRFQSKSVASFRPHNENRNEPTRWPKSRRSALNGDTDRNVDDRIKDVKADSGSQEKDGGRPRGGRGKRIKSKERGTRGRPGKFYEKPRIPDDDVEGSDQQPEENRPWRGRKRPGRPKKEKHPSGPAGPQKWKRPGTPHGQRRKPKERKENNRKDKKNQTENQKDTERETKLPVKNTNNK